MAGIRKSSIKKSISARTTGRAKRKIKGAINPLYGKKGMGYINNPKKAIYNKKYNKTTYSPSDSSGCSTGCLFGFMMILAIPIIVIFWIINVIFS